MIISDEQKKAFEAAADPLIKWISENCHPHCRVIVDSTKAELIEGIVIIKNEKYLKD